jgi:hypothetical protein
LFWCITFMAFATVSSMDKETKLSVTMSEAFIMCTADNLGMTLKTLPCYPLTIDF